MLHSFFASRLRRPLTTAAVPRITPQVVAVPVPAPAPHEAVSLEGSAELERLALLSLGEPWACGESALQALALLHWGRQGASNEEDHVRRLM
jgi:hypothetical protein